jgi:hypothetical protein
MASVISRPRSITFGASVVLNIVFLVVFLVHELNSPTQKLGVLTRNVSAGSFGKGDVAFTLPMGLTVVDVSPQGFTALGRFENSRYAIVITTEDRKLVDFNATPKHEFGELYSVDDRPQTNGK